MPSLIRNALRTYALLAAGLLLFGCSPRPERGAAGDSTPAYPATADSLPLPRPPEADPEAVPLADLRRDLKYQVDLEVLEDSAFGLGTAVLQAQATVTNVSAHAVRLEHSGCTAELIAYRDSTRTGSPAWRSARAAGFPVAVPSGCPLPLIRPVLAPGESYTGGRGVGWLGVRRPVAEVYADSLPTGRYFFDLLLKLNDDTVRIPAGSAVLPPSRFHLGAEYPLDGFHYTAQAQQISSSPRTVEVRVVVRNAGLRSSLTRYIARECPIVLHAYPSAAAQRTAPPKPVWVSPRHCAPGAEPVRLGTGEERVLTRRITARQVLGDSLPRGRYYLTAIVPLLTREGKMEKRVWLDAGAFDLP